MTFPARFDGTCAASCGERIHPGDEIGYDADGKTRHAECLGVETPDSDPTKLRATEVVCPDCWTVKPCRCDDG